MIYVRSAIAGLALTLASSGPASAATTILTANLRGANEIPAAMTPATGLATVTFDDATNILDIRTTFSGLLGTTVASHIHCCVGPTMNGPVATVIPALPGFPLGVTSGSYSGSLDLTLASSFNPSYITANGGTVDAARSALVSGLLSNQAYFNLHSTAFPGGEIRGQLTTAVPEPATWGLLVIGFGAIGATMRAANRRSRSTIAAA